MGGREFCFFFFDLGEKKRVKRAERKITLNVRQPFKEKTNNEKIESKVIF